MMPVKEILAMRPKEPGPPILTIDETTISRTRDAGPVCGCYEKFCTIEKYKPFLPGGVHPYKRREIPEAECLHVVWKRAKIGSWGLNLDKPVAVHISELPEDFSPKQEKDEELLYTRLPIYSDAYYQERLRQCKMGHADGSKCCF